MKDRRFIELVNLYIDRQISADETAELEAEIQSNPRRRAVYRQYCQMHRATTLVFDSFRTQAPDQPATAVARPGSIARFEGRSSGRGYHWVYYAGGLAAAACLALLFVRLDNTRPAGAGPGELVVADPQPAAQIAAVPPPAVMIPVNASERPKAGLISLRNVAAEPDYAALLTALRQEEQRNGEVRSGRQPSLFEDGVFEVPQGFPAGNQRTFRSRQTPAQQAEFTAFQFQR